MKILEQIFENPWTYFIAGVALLIVAVLAGWM